MRIGCETQLSSNFGHLQISSKIIKRKKKLKEKGTFSDEEFSLYEENASSWLGSCAFCTKRHMQSHIQLQ
jgi:hypothetical protein